MKLGIVGVGVIGRAVLAAAESKGFETVLVDHALQDSHSLQSMLSQNTDAIFICLPTPASPDGGCDISTLRSVLNRIAYRGYDGPIISHSTAPWKFYESWSQIMRNLVHVPEFVTGAGANQEYKQQQRMIIGGELWSTKAAAVILNALLSPQELIHMQIGEAAFVKYLANSFLATKVVFMNQMYDLCRAAGMDWNNVSGAAQRDTRLGNTHWQVPGPDGQRGFGGACFPKDTDALLHQSDQLGIRLSILEAALKANEKLRKIY